MNQPHHSANGVAVREYVTGHGSQIAIFGKEMNVSRNRQSCAQVKDNCDDKIKLRMLYMVSS